ncbi:VOC family protein [Actinomadura graeca]|uniref:VOC family protein n=1 Tax=Actinomadura graeca TaxID=2750812 RepID=A0ABX8QLX8_9ACTN|nr:VOC family protein [Actinomadura graeca]QXJ19577.1 VOC family protein [Actinomadura graeca]
MTITRMSRLSLPVSDQDRAKDFYVGVLGFEVLGDSPVPFADGARWLEVGPAGGGTSAVLVTWLEMEPGALTGLMLETTDIDADLARLRGAGVDVHGPADTPWGRQATFADPDGNGIVLAEAAAGAA